MYKAAYNEKVCKLATIEEARERYRLGRTLLIKIADENGALRKIGKAVRIDIPAMDKALEEY